METIELRNLRNQLKAAQLNLKNKHEVVEDYQAWVRENVEHLRPNDPKLVEGKLKAAMSHQAELQAIFLEMHIEELTKEIKEMEDGL